MSEAEEEPAGQPLPGGATQLPVHPGVRHCEARAQRVPLGHRVARRLVQ